MTDEDRKDSTDGLLEDEKSKDEKKKAEEPDEMMKNVWKRKAAIDGLAAIEKNDKKVHEIVMERLPGYRMQIKSKK